MLLLTSHYYRFPADPTMMLMSLSVSRCLCPVPSPQVVQPIERVLASRSDIKVGLMDERKFGNIHVLGFGVIVVVGGSRYRNISAQLEQTSPVHCFC